MLILTRKRDESLIIDGNIEVRIIALDDGKVKVGIEAPREVEIYRKEVYDKIQEENRQSKVAQTSVDQLKKFMKK